MKRFLRWALAGLGLLVLAYFGLLVISGLSPNVNDRDLRLTREKLSPADNGFERLQIASSQLWWPKEKETALRQLVTGTNWNATLATEVLARNQAALAALDAAIAATGLQVPEFSQSDELPYLAQWKRLGELAIIRANAAARAGQAGQAFDQGMKLVQLAGRMEDCGGAVLHYLVGAAIKAQGLAAIRRWAGTTRLAPQQFVELARQLQSVGDDGTALTNALKTEYTLAMQTLGDLRSGKFKGQNQVPLISWRLLPVFNQGRTKQLFADRTRALLAAISMPYNAANLPDLDASRPSPARLILSGNAGGQIFFYLMMPALNGTIRTKSRDRVQLEATRAILALRACQLKNGRLPEDLAALTPEFLETVPLDDFDGEPLRYAPERKLLYSIGENLKDDQGEAKDAQDRRLDYPFPFDF